MENVQEKCHAANFKKWLIMAFMTFLLVIPMGSAFASTILPTGKISSLNVLDYEVDYKPSQSAVDSFLVNATATAKDNIQPVVFKDTTGKTYLRLVAWNGDGGVFVLQDSNLYAIRSIYFLDVNSNTNSSGPHIVGGSSAFTSGISDFFLAKAVQNPVAVQARVTDLPVAILGPLTTGGILGVGLTILAIMLGVSLVPRLVHSFSR